MLMIVKYVELTPLFLLVISLLLKLFRLLINLVFTVTFTIVSVGCTWTLYSLSNNFLTHFFSS